MMNVCPVCGFFMKYPPSDFHICPSCGTEFGYDDSGTTYEVLRERWIASGKHWWSPVDPQPPHWNPDEQLKRVTVLNAPIQHAAVYTQVFMSGNNNVPMMPVSRERGARRRIEMGHRSSNWLNPLLMPA